MRLSACILAMAVTSCAATDLPPTSPITPPLPGKLIAFNRDKGNCLACHAIDGGEFPGNIGPPLTNLPKRFSDKSALREQIWDATRFNPNTSMPPFGRNKILTETEIDQLVDYLWGL
jgi:L-cysteine S-thiosulfotransferase